MNGDFAGAQLWPRSPKSAPEQTALNARTAITIIWFRPRAVLGVISHNPRWWWPLPIGLALLLFYTRLFLLVYLGVPGFDWMLVGGLSGVFLGWPVSTALLTLLSKRHDAPLPFNAMLNLYAWTTLPLTVRDAVQVVFMLFTGRALTNPGLSGLLDPLSVDAPGWAMRVGSALLSRFDLYTLWHLGLLVLAVGIGAKLARRDALWIVAQYSTVILVFSGIVMLF